MYELIYVVCGDFVMERMGVGRVYNIGFMMKDVLLQSINEKKGFLYYGFEEYVSIGGKIGGVGFVYVCFEVWYFDVGMVFCLRGWTGDYICVTKSIGVVVWEA